MAVEIRSAVWAPAPSLYLFIFFSCLLSLFLSPYAVKNTFSRASAIFDHGLSPSFIRFQRNFLLLYSLASGSFSIFLFLRVFNCHTDPWTYLRLQVATLTQLIIILMDGFWSVFGEFEFTESGVGREQAVLSLCSGYAVAVLVGPFLGVLTDLIGPRKVCLVFCYIHFSLGIWKRMIAGPSIIITSIGASLATSIFSFSFETWMVNQHEQLGHRQDMLSDTFWLMTFFESVSSLGSQMLVNWLICNGDNRNVQLPLTVAVFMALSSIIIVTRGCTEVSLQPRWKEYRASLCAYIFGDRRIWLLSWAQASLHLSIVVIWILWAPSLVADGREVNLGLIYPCFLGTRMLGSSIFPLLTGGSSPPRTEDFLVYGFLVAGLVLSIISYDYQELGVLVTLFCSFHACVGLILPSLARLRTMYVPNELRGGMISFSQVPANAALLFFFLQGGYYRNIENSSIIALAALGLIISAGCMHVLKRWGKQPYQNWSKQ